MQCALFGKLPAKRDFIALGAPREFLSVYEPWLTGGISASRIKMGAAWQKAFLTAPIWRFWFGPGICGQTVAGCFMPSVDGVGRYFPLTLLAYADAGAPIAPPELDPQDAWFRAAEECLLSALDPEMNYDALSARVGALPPPRAGGAGAVPEGLVRLSDGTMMSRIDLASFPARLSTIRVEDFARAYHRTSVFWTAGGDAYPPLAMVGLGLPAPEFFGGFLNGQFGTYLQ